MPDDLRDHWTLDPGVAFLNHGSFGACPREVLAEQDRWRARMEREPVRFFVKDLERLLDRARERLADFLGAAPDDLVLVPNATAGINSVLRSLDLSPGDELLTTDHEYGACLNTLDHVAGAAGARRVTAEVPFPLDAPDRVVEAVLAAVTPRTRLALLSHVTSATGLVLPLAEMVAALRERGVETLVDGAHAPGMIPLDVPAVGAAYYTGNGHKWLCAPKGAGFLWVRRDRQATVRPYVISHGASTTRTDRSRYQVEFGWTGTLDPSAYLCLPAALDFMGGLLAGGWDELRTSNRRRVLQGRDALCAALGIEPPAPDTMIGALASVPLPESEGAPPTSPLYADPLQDELMARCRAQVPVIPWPSHPRRLLRISAQAYNRPEEYRRLARALGAIFAGNRA